MIDTNTKMKKILLMLLLVLPVITFSQKGKGPVRIIRMGEQDYDDKRQRRLGGEIDRGIHPMMEAIKSGGPVHIPATMVDLKLLISHLMYHYHL